VEPVARSDSWLLICYRGCGVSLSTAESEGRASRVAGRLRDLSRFDAGAGEVPAGKTPMGRVSDVGSLAVFLAPDESAWITGKVIRAAGGLFVAT